MSRRLDRSKQLGELSREDVVKVFKLGLKTISHDWIVDETRQPHMVSVFENAAEYVEVVKCAYRRDNWQTQEN